MERNPQVKIPTGFCQGYGNIQVLNEDEMNIRMTGQETPYGIPEVKAWIGNKAYSYWKGITQMIETRYPGIFVPEWLYGGKKHGWYLRYKKNKSFCTLVPEKGCLKVLIVFGADERAKVETIRDDLSETVQEQYDKATTYHDGKWLLLTVDSKTVLKDIELLLEVKRKPRN